MNVTNVSGRLSRSNSFMRRSAGVALASVFLLGLASPAPAQLSTNYWATLVGGNWSTALSWSNSAIPNAAGALVYLSGNNDIGGGFSGSPNTINLDQDATVGYLLWGARSVGRQVHITDTTATRTLTFDTGDGKMALISHSSGDLNRNVGADADTSAVRTLVTDPEGL
ncbi:MAG: hypothetical protein KJ579_02600, partial [Verrucomicrobia bacterium]|nr:hypothetical protein [Verrucomicrobiota bacterium]